MDARTGTVFIDHPEGQIEVPAEAVLRLTEPLLGFPGRLEYVLLPTVRQGIWWFISVGEPSVTFVLADPFIAKPGYTVEIEQAHLQSLEISSSEAPLALVMVALPSDNLTEVTANFRAPVVVNLEKGLASQIVLRDETVGVGESISLSSFTKR